MLNNPKGFTLIEIMVVVAIMAAIAGLVLPRIGSQNNKIKAEIRSLVSITRQVRSLARLQNSTYRLVIDMKDGPDSKEAHEYWLERAAGAKLLAEDREEEYEKRMEALREGKDKDEEEKSPTSDDGFSAGGGLLNKPKSLPSDMIFESIEVPGFDDPVSEGRVYIHFFPSGMVEEAAIHLKLDEAQWTVATHPLTGKSDIVTKFMSLKEIKDQ